MANSNVGGLKPVRNLSGSPYNGPGNIYSTSTGDGTAIYIGDLVTLVGTAQTINGAVYADVQQSATGDVFQGVVMSVLPVDQSSTIYRAANTQRLIEVCDDPNVVFEATEIGTGTPLALNDIGLNINISVGSGSTVTGFSGMVLDNGTEQTTNTLDMKITGFVNAPDNAVGAFAKWYVRINRHRYVNQVAGV